MSYKFFYLYLIGGIIALILLVYDVISMYPNIWTTELLWSVIPAILLFYLACKVWHEKNDQELM